LKFINDTQRAIAVTSSEEVKGKLSQDSTADLFAKRESILQICQRKFPDCPRDKLIRRQTRHGCRTANDNLASDIIALMKYYTSGEISVEFNEIFKNFTTTITSSDTTLEILKTLGSKHFIKLAEDLDVKLCQLIKGRF
jgi:hypothetical protein